MDDRHLVRTGPPRRSYVGGLLGLAAIAVLGACNLHQQGVTPPKNRIFFPGGGIVAPEGRWLYVVNSNADLRYNAGTVAAVDLDAIRGDYDKGVLPPRMAWSSCSPDPKNFVPPASVKATDSAQCCWDFIDPNVLNCDEQAYIDKGATVRIGSFGGRPAFQRFALPGASATASPPVAAGIGQRMFVPVRGNGSVTMMDVAALADADGKATSNPRFYCSGNRTDPNQVSGTFTQDPFSECEDAWRITRKLDPAVVPEVASVPEAEILRLPEEAYALAVDDRLTSPFLYVGHLRSGAVSLVSLGNGTDENPELIASNAAILPPDANGSRGITSLRIRYPGSLNDPNTCGGPIYATSRYAAVASSFVVAGINGADCRFTSQTPLDDRTLAIVGRGDSLSSGVPGNETAGIEFISKANLGATTAGGGDGIFILQRLPPVVAAIDANTNRPFATIEVCQGPVSLSQQTDLDGVSFSLDGPSLFVTCYDSGEVYVVDASALRIKAIIPIGRGPIQTIFDPRDPKHGYVVGFSSNSISVLDLDPTSPTHYRVIQRIGFPSATPREIGPQ